LKDLKGEVTFEDVTFGYLEAIPVLKEVSFKVQPGKVVAVVGPTGSGKTTLINLLMRFYDVDKGRILIDGINIKNIKRDVLRRSHFQWFCKILGYFMVLYMKTLHMAMER
jgi:ATP-binding cassette, subfamily B, multidrug efflux pump